MHLLLIPSILRQREKKRKKEALATEAQRNDRGEKIKIDVAFCLSLGFVGCWIQPHLNGAGCGTRRGIKTRGWLRELVVSAAADCPVSIELKDEESSGQMRPVVAAATVSVVVMVGLRMRMVLLVVGLAAAGKFAFVCASRD